MAKLESESDGLGCLFLDMLPPEMRNNIYELVYANDTSEDNEINLLTAEPPSKALMLASRQMHDEAAKIYKSSYCEFWSQSSFTLYTSWRNNYECNLEHFRSQDLQHITRLQLCLEAVRGPHCYDLICPNGWRYYTEIEGKKHIFAYIYYGSSPDDEVCQTFHSKQDLLSWHEAAPSGLQTDLAYQVHLLPRGR